MAAQPQPKERPTRHTLSPTGLPDAACQMWRELTDELQVSQVRSGGPVTDRMAEMAPGHA